MIQQLLFVFCFCIITILGILTLMFIGAVYGTLLFEIVPDKWQEYMERKNRR